MKDLIPLTKKLQRAINKMEKEIKSKDEEIRILRLAFKRLQNSCVSVANLTPVSIC